MRESPKLFNRANWPVYFNAQLNIGNLKSPVGIATLWTLKDFILKDIEKEYYACCGQLYSKDGINYIIRNLLANPRIRYLILCGDDRSDSGKTLKDFFLKNKMGNMDREIPIKFLGLLRKNVAIIDLIKEKSGETVLKKIKKLDRCIVKPWAKPQVFPEAITSTLKTFPSDPSIFKVRRETAAKAWPWILKYIMKFGAEKGTKYGVKQKEIMNLATVIYDEDSQRPEIPEYFGFSREEFEKYAPQILDPQPPRGIEYTYGARLRSYLGIDQIYDGVIAELKKFPESRRAVACIWYTPTDYKSQQPPCVNLIQGLVQNNNFYMMVYIRSNDMFNAWPQNVLALRRLQELIAKEIEMPIGDLTTISASAHIYEQDFKKARAIIEKYAAITHCEWDPRGNFVIGLDRQSNEIVVSHYSPDGIKIAEYRGKNSRELRNVIDKNLVISQIGHALYLGEELHKAEIALKTGQKYTQDRPIS